tara:strand:+ start:89 stop:295 length:207 start_codon:yes stop_codon:yes gene_type:complete
MKYVYRAWCEWDCGQDNIIFATEDLANEWLSVAAMADLDEDSVYSDLLDENLVGIDEVEFICKPKEPK